MKVFYLLLLTLLSVQIVNAQCTFSGGDNHLTEATIEACLNASSCGIGGVNCTVTLNSGSYDRASSKKIQISQDVDN